jgi:hypothetical protein
MQYYRKNVLSVFYVKQALRSHIFCLDGLYTMQLNYVNHNPNLKQTDK